MKKVKSFLTSVLTDGKDNISVGSFCIFFFTLVFSFATVYALVLDKKMPVTGYEMGSILLALYGAKKLPQMMESRNQGCETPAPPAPVPNIPIPNKPVGY